VDHVVGSWGLQCGVGESAVTGKHLATFAGHRLNSLNVQVAAYVTALLHIPTIGIGAGPYTRGQVGHCLLRVYAFSYCNDNSGVSLPRHPW
jgi:hypothetical protein